jgi:hypothetical protein
MTDKSLSSKRKTALELDDLFDGSTSDTPKGGLKDESIILYL